MLSVLLGIYPPRTPEGGQQTTILKEPTSTPISANAAQIQVEKVGEPVKSGDTVTVTVRVTNNVNASPHVPGNTEGAATPPPEPATVLNATIKVYFYMGSGATREIAGSGIGNVVNLKYGESAEVQIPCTPVEEFSDWEALPSTVWTDKDPVKQEAESGPGGEAGATPEPAPAEQPANPSP
jgi:hypothetical protein